MIYLYQKNKITTTQVGFLGRYDCWNHDDGKITQSQWDGCFVNSCSYQWLDWWKINARDGTNIFKNANGKMWLINYTQIKVNNQLYEQ